MLCINVPSLNSITQTISEKKIYLLFDCISKHLYFFLIYQFYMKLTFTFYIIKQSR